MSKKDFEIYSSKSRPVKERELSRKRKLKLKPCPACNPGGNVLLGDGEVMSEETLLNMNFLIEGIDGSL